MLYHFIQTQNVSGITEQFLNSLLSDVGMKIQLSGSKIEICSLGVVTVPKIRYSGSVGVAVRPRCGSPLVTGMTASYVDISSSNAVSLGHFP